MLQNLPNFWNKKIQIVFLFLILSNFGFLTVDAWSMLIVDIDCKKSQVALKMKNEKKTMYLGFSYSKNMANFEAFR